MDNETALPSGRQYRLASGDQTVVLTEVGAAIRSYTIGERPVLDGYDESEPCTGARGQTMIPWPNRVKGGHYTWEQHPQQLDLTEPSKGGAIHGLTRWANWDLVEHTQSKASFRYVLHACPGWNGVLDCRLDYTLENSGLTVRTTATNIGSSPCPYGTGAHPYLTVGTSTINGVRVRVPGSAYLPVDDLGIPVGENTVEGTSYDLRIERELGSRQFDDAYTKLLRGDDGRARVRLELPDGPAVELWADESYPFLEIFTGDTLPQEKYRRTGLGVEPMTCAPDAFKSGNGLITLNPHESHTALWGINPDA
ncbi:aldose 1-epimerase family protein [Arthrobacter rhombi]|uniref:aldose 1-epimerase family protein n=1 Tax=Arthrobacter rhombi TaxID=71253 RepID=UPI003FD26F46